jgi:hypothetical protein
MDEFRVSNLRRIRLIRAATFLAALGFAGSASAYCRTTTCDSEKMECPPCAAPGLPLYWRSSCVSFGVQQDGSPLRGITYDETHAIVAEAFQKWKSAQCAGGTPSFEMADLGAISCGEPQYNQIAPNANVWMFRDDEWPYEDPDATDAVRTSKLAVTAVTFFPATGEIYDADVEINSKNLELTMSDENVEYDLESIVTHEAGHFLGLDHSLDGSSTMYDFYNPGDVGMRTLTPDDEAGICAAFPPNDTKASSSCTPRHGFSSQCEVDDFGGGCCSTAPGRPTPADARAHWLAALVAGLVGVVVARRRGRFAA